MISGIIMASGFSKRMNREKLLLEVDGIPIVERVVGAAVNSELGEVILVYQNEKIGKIAYKYNLKAVYNNRAAEGQSSALKLGITNASELTDGYLLLVGDQPFLTSNTINILLSKFKKMNTKILCPLYNGHKGTPNLISSCYKNEIFGITGDVGARNVIKHHSDEVKFIDIENEIEGMDIDTWEEYVSIR